MYGQSLSEQSVSRRNVNRARSLEAFFGTFSASTLVVALVLFIAAWLYFSQTAWHLQPGAGPDYHAHNDITEFINKHRRLPVLPADEDALQFTSHGGTRALRPPLTYLLSATLAGPAGSAADEAELTRQESFYRFRRGSVLLGALTVLAVFLAARVYVNSTAIAAVGALLVALWPQITFIFSYNNDDAGALFTGSLLLLSLVLVDRHGPQTKYAVLLGVAGGLIILSKPTAWLWLPTLLLFVLRWGVRFGPGRLAKPALLAFMVALITGGWWLAFNAWHYGADDIFLNKITQQMAAKHSRLDEGYAHGYQADGIGVIDLLLNDRGNFYTLTFYSTVANLDWLRLRLRPSLYTAFAGLGLVVLLTSVWRGIRYVVRHDAAREPANAQGTRGTNFGADWILLFACLFQFMMYVYANVYNDVQLQGKYILPVVAAFILLFASQLRYYAGVLESIMTRYGIYEVSLNPVQLGRIALGVIALIMIAYHRDAVVNYVVPFYETPGIDVPLRGINVGRVLAFRPIADENGPLNDIEAITVRGSDTVVRVTGADPWFVLNPKYCANARGNSLLEIKMTTPNDDLISLYWNDGKGFNERQRRSSRYRKGKTTIYLWAGAQHCRQLRIDPSTSPGDVVIHSIILIPLQIDAHTTR